VSIFLVIDLDILVCLIRYTILVATLSLSLSLSLWDLIVGYEGWFNDCIIVSVIIVAVVVVGFSCGFDSNDGNYSSSIFSIDHIYPCSLLLLLDPFGRVDFGSDSTLRYRTVEIFSLYRNLLLR